MPRTFRRAALAACNVAMSFECCGDQVVQLRPVVVPQLARAVDRQPQELLGRPGSGALLSSEASAICGGRVDHGRQ